MSIDFVIMWVDGSDPNWLAEKRKYTKSTDLDDRPERYRDWDLLRFWFRGVEQFAPWVRKIHFVTWGHIPEWLNRDNPKLQIVVHEQIIPKEKLPLFNSSSIECFLHRIPDLADQFVFFNDDFFVIDTIKPEVFFQKEKPVDMLAFQPVVANPGNPVMSSIFMNNSLILCKHFDKRKMVKEHPGDYFHIGYPPLYFFYNLLELCFPLYTGFYTVHGPSPFLKSTFETVWREEEETLETSTRNRFRSKEDLTQYLFREWQKLSGNFVPKNILKYQKYFEVGEDNRELVETIRKQKHRMICINDTGRFQNQEAVRAELQQAFLTILPKPSTFEC